MNKNFIEFAVFKLIDKKLSKKETIIINFMLNLMHTFDLEELIPASSMIAFLMTGCGLDYPQVLSASINSFGKNHYCFTDIANFMLNNFKTESKYFPGFGHPVFKDKDPRVEAIIELMQDLKYESPTLKKAIKFSESKKINLNIGGICAAILIDCGFDSYTINYFPVISRMLGISLIYKKLKNNNVRFATSLDNIDKYKNLFKKNSS